LNLAVPTSPLCTTGRFKWMPRERYLLHLPEQECRLRKARHSTGKPL